MIQWAWMVRILALAALIMASLALRPAFTQAIPAGTLFAALGGHDKLVAIVEDAALTWRADPRIAATFENTSPARFNRLLVEQLCALTGGGCTYTGRAMQAAHADLSLDRRQFNALVEGLQSAMDRQGVAFSVQNRLLAILAPMQREVVTR